MAFIAIAKLEDILPLGARRWRRADGVEIAVFRTDAGGVFALRDKCPHKGGPLSQGIVFGESVACPLHNWCIGLADGRAAPPDVGVVERFPARVEGDDVLLDPEAGVLEAKACSAPEKVTAP